MFIVYFEHRHLLLHYNFDLEVHYKLFIIEMLRKHHKRSKHLLACACPFSISFTHARTAYSKATGLFR